MTRARAVAALALGALAAVACDRLASNISGAAGLEAGLLRGKLPVASRGTPHASRLTDGIAAEPGDPGRTDLTAELASSGSFVTWDLGAVVPVRCALLDADGETTFTLSISKDGKDFAVLYRAAPDEDRGQQLRAGRELGGEGRYLLLSAAGGEAHRSVSEVSAWSTCPKTWPPLALQKGTPDDEAVRLKLWGFAALAVAYVLAYRRRGPDWLKLVGVAPAGAGVSLAVQLAELWPPSRALAIQLGVVLVALLAALAARRLFGRAPPTATS